MVDCPTEDVPFREGAFGGAGDGIQRARLPFARTVWFPVWLSPPFLLQKENRQPLLRGVAGCATGSARPLGAQTMLGRASKPLRFVPLVPSLREDPNSHVGAG
jgi:hypothetical protein